MGIRMETFREGSARWGGQLVELRGLKEEAPISGSTVSFPVCLGVSGSKGVAGQAPGHLQVLGEGGREAGREEGREKKREREKDRRTVGIRASRVPTISRLSSPGVAGCS